MGLNAIEIFTPIYKNLRYGFFWHGICYKVEYQRPVINE